MLERDVRSLTGGAQWNDHVATYVMVSVISLEVAAVLAQSPLRATDARIEANELSSKRGDKEVHAASSAAESSPSAEQTEPPPMFMPMPPDWAVGAG